MRHGGTILVQALKANRVERVFSVPGESFLAALDGLHDSGIQNIVCRHEGGAAMMAEAAGKLSGRTGVAFVTRGPGATNASAGVHVARQDSTPMILFVGQIARGDTDRDAFQEVDFRAMFGPLAKWVAQIDATNRIAEYVRRAFAVAMSGRPGPVVLAHHQVQLAPPSPVVLAEPAVLIAVRVGLSVLLPEQEQGDILAREFVTDVLPVGDAPGLCRQIRWLREQQLLQMGLVQIRWQWPAQTGLNRAAQVFAHSGAADAADRRNLAVTQFSVPFETEDIFDLAHG